MNEEKVASGWAVFAGVMLIIVGALNVIYGLAAVLNDDILVTGGQGAIIADISAWGWVHLVLGSIMVLTGLGLFSGAPSARVMAVVFVTINAIAQVGLLTAFPLWAIMMIALDVLILYNLIVKGGMTTLQP